ncbi:MAG: PssD/Cps14F family polysaccharide biosynthesis glycosyltransferase [Candidatus Odinarchaeia archaeon]
MVILGGGGHTYEMNKLIRKLGKREYIYVANHDDVLSAVKLDFPGKVYKIVRPRKPGEAPFKALIRTLIAFIQSFILLILTNPQVIIGNGPALNLPIFYAGKILGKRLIYVESVCRVYRLSLTGRLLLKIADLFFVQWKELKNKYPNTIYAGRLI